MENQVRDLIKDNYVLKMQNAQDTEAIEQLTHELQNLRQPNMLKAQSDELRDIKCSVYGVISKCQQQLMSHGMDYDGELDIQNNLRLNRELFSLELVNQTDLSRFLTWEVSHLQTINDLANQLRRLISVQDFQSVTEVRRQIESMLSPQQLKTTKTYGTVEQMADMACLNLEMQRSEIIQINEATASMQHSYEQRIMQLE